ncbi:MAG TPA: hypothetical protein VFA63_14175, partial [Pseudonocardiaceae bacterium]|nr:hypothetical protein [Pseudonocardiaceae bacterium]
MVNAVSDPLITVFCIQNAVAYTIEAMPSSSSKSSRDKGSRDKGSRKRSIQKGSAEGHSKRRAARMRTVAETSAGGLVVDTETGHAAVIGRLDRRGRLLWSLPKGHVEH